VASCIDPSDKSPEDRTSTYILQLSGCASPSDSTMARLEAESSTTEPTCSSSTSSSLSTASRTFLQKSSPKILRRHPFNFLKSLQISNLYLASGCWSSKNSVFVERAQHFLHCIYGDLTISWDVFTLKYNLKGRLIISLNLYVGDGCVKHAAIYDICDKLW
jgi:hypothetical protein